ncbi:Patched-related [Carabus blaptoides fortunei]
MLSSLGFLRFHQEKNPIKLWVPEDSSYIHDTEWLINTFKIAQRPQVILMKADNVLIPEVLQELNNINEKIINSRTQEGIRWDDVCFKIPTIDPSLVRMIQKFKAFENDFDPSVWNSDYYCQIIESLIKECYQRSILEIFKYDSNILRNMTNEDIINYVNVVDISPVTGHPVNYTELLGGIRRNSTGHIISAQVVLSFYYAEVNFTAVEMDKTGNDFGTGDWVTESVLKWENEFLKILTTAQRSSENMEIYYASGRSFSDISQSTMLHDMPALVVGVLIMIVYIQLAVSRFNCIDCRVLIGFVGLFSVALSFLVACGLCSLFGVFYGPVHTSLPFLLMGLGVDDIFVIISFWNQLAVEQMRGSLPQRIGYMLRHAGVSISLTSITDFMAFLVGSFTILPSLKSFCIYAAVGVLCTFIFVITFFTACITLDQKRIEENRNGCVPCYKYGVYERNKCSQKQISKHVYHFIYSKIILTVPGKIIVIMLTIVLTGFGLYGSLQLEQKFDPMWFVPESTYFYKYIEQRKLYFPNMGFEAGIYMGKINYTQEYPNIKSVASKLDNLTDILQVTSSWVQPFQYYVKKTFNKENLKCGMAAKQILASSIDFQFRGFKGPHEHLPAMHEVYSISDNANLTSGDRFVTVWGRIFGNWMTDEVIDKELTRNLGLALVCVMFCTMVLIANLQICFWIFICVLLTMVNVCGWIQIWGLTIDLVSCIALTLGIGLCVDYAAHIGYMFVTVNGNTRQDRVLTTVTSIGLAVLHGGLSTLLALCMLSQSEAYTFQAFFKIFLLVVLFGQFYGGVLLPVVLSLVGPKPHLTHQSVQQTEL